jgi:hypothetical protein
MKEFKHLMLDIETLGTKSNSVVLNITAVAFDIETGDTGATFNQNISIESSLLAGLKVDAGTLKFWLQQDKEALKHSLVEPQTLTDVLYEFSAFCNKNYQVWGRSPRFDWGLVQNLYNNQNLEIPWDFRKERDVRTLEALRPEIKANTTREGLEHTGIGDCIHQIKYCVAIWNDLK